MIKEFTTAINNSQKMYPPLYLLPETFEIEGKQVIYIRVPEGYQVCRHNGRIWDRSYEGDINIRVIGQNVLVVNPKNKQEMNRIYVILTTQ